MRIDLVDEDEYEFVVHLEVQYRPGETRNGYIVTNRTPYVDLRMCEFVATKGSRNNNFTFCGRLSGLTIGIKLQKDLAILRVGRPSGRGGGRASAALPLLGDEPHRLRRGALHLPTRRSRQNVTLFLREP